MYRLCGALSMQSKAPSLLIPIFSSPFSNHIYAQNITKNRIIEEFLKIDPDMFYKTEWIPPIVNLTVGDEGIFAYDIGNAGNSEFIFGKFEELCETLSSHEFSNPYFNLEVSDVICSVDLHESAIVEISKDIHSEKISKQWVERERRVRGVIRSKAFKLAIYNESSDLKKSRFDEEFSDLYNNPFEKKVARYMVKFMA